jgi:signal peptidase I
MIPAIEPGDWLLVDPTTRRWPRAGSVVLFREPDSGELAVKRVAARSGERVSFAGGFLVIGPGEAWLTADATTAATSGAGFGPPIDSTRFGPVALQALVGRVWLRYGPLARFGRIPRPVPGA